MAYDRLPVVLQTYFATKLMQYKPLPVGSPQYYENLNITYSQGAINSAARRQYDTNTSLFWADLDGMPLVRASCRLLAPSGAAGNAVSLHFSDNLHVSATNVASMEPLAVVQAPRRSMGTTSPSPRACCPATPPCWLPLNCLPGWAQLNSTPMSSAGEPSSLSCSDCCCGGPRPERDCLEGA